MGHQGSVEKKVKAIENIDEFVIGPLVEALKEKGEDFRMLILLFSFFISPQMFYHKYRFVPQETAFSSQRAGCVRSLGSIRKSLTVWDLIYPWNRNFRLLLSSLRPKQAAIMPTMEPVISEPPLEKVLTLPSSFAPKNPPRSDSAERCFRYLRKTAFPLSICLRVLIPCRLLFISHLWQFYYATVSTKIV